MTVVECYSPQEVDRYARRRRKADRLREPLSAAGGLSLTLSASLGALAGSSVWTPAALGSALVGWWDYSDDNNVTLDGSQNISQVDDKSGKGYHSSQSTSGARPGRSVWRNGLKAAVFDGVDDFLESPVIASTSSTNWLVCWAGDWDEDGGDSVLWQMGSSPSIISDYFASYYLPYFSGPGVASYWEFFTGRLPNVPSYADVLFTTSGESQFFWLGTPCTKYTGANVLNASYAFDGFTFGALRAPRVNFFGGKLGEAFVISGAAANATTAALSRAYLKFKWGF